MKNMKTIVVGIMLLSLVSSGLFAEQGKTHYVVIEIEGMTCPLCPVAIKKSLVGLEGVKDVVVSLEDRKAWLRADETVSNAVLLKAIERAGSYKGKIIERKKPENNL